MKNMKKNIFLSLSMSLLAMLLMLSSCASEIHEGYRAPDYDLALQKQEIINNTKSIKVINAYDELGCEAYDITNPQKKAGVAGLDYVLGDDHKEGTGSFKLKYNFIGRPNDNGREIVYLQQRWGDYRVDLSFHPLGLSIWVKGIVTTKMPCSASSSWKMRSSLTKLHHMTIRANVGHIMPLRIKRCCQKMAGHA